MTGFGSGVDLAGVAVGTGGFVVNGEVTDDFSRASVARAGDVIGDGFNDFLIGAHLAAPSRAPMPAKPMLYSGR